MVLCWKQNGYTKLTTLFHWTTGSLLLGHGYSCRIQWVSIPNSSKCISRGLSPRSATL